eukprot:TRINITY_DN111425_c0_g1_i1.p1 TRINITY_DN111425_c0_g1~~TRINITY_DN111425_c0_g1_i1.p1  ORF type:complete len:280 (+),score=48.23 TRINITY_DN111425_c0_g1_i1:54-893(+)
MSARDAQLAKKKSENNKMKDNDVFLSKRSINKFPQTAADTLFFTATTYDYNATPPREKAEGKGENFLRLHEIGRRDCKDVKYPDIPLLTRHSQTYTIMFPHKKATDLEVNKYAADLKKEGSTSAGPSLALSAKSHYQDTFVRSSPLEMRRAKPAPIFSSSAVSKKERSLVLKSTSQTTYAGEHSGFKATGEQVLPVHQLEVDNGSPADFWRSRKDLEYVDHSLGGYKGQSSKWRKRHGTKMVDSFLNDMGDSIRRMNSAPTLGLMKPVSMIGSNIDPPK